ncbi:MAG: signal peptidase I [Spirochaetes bacterium]|nr:signal peptidase I [Spirochaetota bacterium]
MVEKNGFNIALVHFTEAFLSKRKKKLLRQKMRQQSKHWAVDWAEAILWAVCVVLVINQYIFQMYRIPSGSMIDTLEIGDMIFVNKYVFGPELLPGLGKLPGLERPRRGQVVIFETPVYISRGTLFSIAQQFIYMLTLTMVDLDREPDGSPRVHYLIKRAIGIGGDRIRVVRGDVYYRFPGASGWIAERDHMNALGVSYHAARRVAVDSYGAIEASGTLAAYRQADLAPPPSLANGTESFRADDQLAFEKSMLESMYAMAPQERRFAEESRRRETGWYVADDRIFPMGDNRDNSRDARYFGTVSGKKVLGKARFIYWPVGRIGPIR